MKKKVCNILLMIVTAASLLSGCQKEQKEEQSYSMYFSEEKEQEYRDTYGGNYFKISKILPEESNPDYWIITPIIAMDDGTFISPIGCYAIPKEYDIDYGSSIVADLYSGTTETITVNGEETTAMILQDIQILHGE